MTLKEELEILRGEPIEVFEGDPMDIPCIETSDPERLCKNPVVSVHMLTYNHEPYIRQAIEGVMMQKTDFEFELVIGEDCSQDKTREICFAYQKKYPDKIRVLWWHENVSNIGGNARRVSARCRGEFIAYCEGDDWWIDDRKLQNQVDVLRRYQSVGLCFTDGYSKSMTSNWQQKWHDYKFASWFPANTPVDESIVARLFCLGKEELGYENSFPFVLTASAMVRKACLQKIGAMYDVFKWELTLGDLIVWLGITSCSTVCYVPIFAVERHVLPTGAQASSGGRVFRDGFLVRYCFAKRNWGVEYAKLPVKLIHSWMTSLLGYARNLTPKQQRSYGRLLSRHKGFVKGLRNPFYLLVYCVILAGCAKGIMGRIASKLLYSCFPH